MQNIEQHDEALAAHKLGVCRLYQLQEKSKIKYIEKNLPHIQRICLNFSSVLECKEITRDLLQSIIVDALLSDGDEIRTKSEFEKRSAQANTRLMVVANEFCAILLEVSRLYKEIKQALSGSTPISWLHNAWHNWPHTGISTQRGGKMDC
ncbi:MAG: DUF3418 domain-containing protein [Gammaproteobacteria bacterium]